MNSKIIDGHEDYLVYQDGRIFSTKSNIFLKKNDNGNGYKTVNLWNKGKQKTSYVHKLVAKAFIPNPNSLPYIDHIDRNKENNHVSNLRWVSAKENTDNTAGKPRYSVERKGASHLSIFQIEQIKQLYSSGIRVMEISRKLNITRQTVSRYVK